MNGSAVFDPSNSNQPLPAAFQRRAGLFLALLIREEQFTAETQRSQRRKEKCSYMAFLAFW